jgi:hypothetical protein
MRAASSIVRAGARQTKSAQTLRTRPEYGPSERSRVRAPPSLGPVSSEARDRPKCGPAGSGLSAAMRWGFARNARPGSAGAPAPTPPPLGFASKKRGDDQSAAPHPGRWPRTGSGPQPKGYPNSRRGRCALRSPGARQSAWPQVGGNVSLARPGPDRARCRAPECRRGHRA